MSENNQLELSEYKIENSGQKIVVSTLHTVDCMSNINIDGKAHITTGIDDVQVIVDELDDDSRKSPLLSFFELSQPKKTCTKIQLQTATVYIDTCKPFENISKILKKDREILCIRINGKYLYITYFL